MCVFLNLPARCPARIEMCIRDRRYTDRIDVESFAVNYLLQELSKNRDFHNPYSTFLYEKDGLLYMGPV